jgi:hypothetical protein
MTKKDRKLIELLEAEGNEVCAYPVDESQLISNAGDAIVYEYLGKKYEVIIWNERAEEHTEGSQEVAEITDED